MSIIATIAAQVPTAEGQLDAWEVEHIPIAMPIPSGTARRSTRSTSRTIGSFLLIDRV